MIIQRSRTPPRRGRGRRVGCPSDAVTSLLFPSRRRGLHHRGCAPGPLAAVSPSTAPTPHPSRASSSAANRSSNRDAGRRIGTPVARDASPPRVKSRSTRLAVRLVGFPAAPARAPGALGASTAPERHARASTCRFVSMRSTGRDDVRGVACADGGARTTTRRRATSSRLPGELCARELRAALKGDLGARFGSGRDGASTSILDAARAALRLTSRTVSGETSSSRRSSRETSGESSSTGEGAGRDARRLRGEGRAGRRGVSSSRSSSESSSRSARRRATRGSKRVRRAAPSDSASSSTGARVCCAGSRAPCFARGARPSWRGMRWWTILPSLGGGAGRAGAGVCHCACGSEGVAVARRDTTASASTSARRNTRGCGSNARRGVGVVSGAIAGVRRNAPGVAHSPSRANAGVNMTPGGSRARTDEGPSDEATDERLRRCADRASRDARRRGETMTRAVRYGGRRARSCGVGTRSRGRVCAEGGPPRGGRRREARASCLHLTVQRPLRDPRARSSGSAIQPSRRDGPIRLTFRMAVSHEECTPYVYSVGNRKCVPPPAAAAEFERSGTTRRAARAIGQFRRRILAGEDTRRRTSHVSFRASKSTRSTDRVDASANAASSARQTAPGARPEKLARWVTPWARTGSPSRTPRPWIPPPSRRSPPRSSLARRPSTSVRARFRATPARARANLALGA